jgi:ectoine hydroxylase-related dioxygenase (phytanoyl-CoA dioxygenase family)
MMPSTHRLAPFELEFFLHNGFLSLASIMDADEIESVRCIYDRLFSSRAGCNEGDQCDLGGNERDGNVHLPQLFNASRHAPELKASSFLANALAIAEQLFGDELKADDGEHMIYTPPLLGGATPWHQDQAYHDPGLIYRSVNFWMPLDDAAVDDGCMQFVPGSHRLDVLPHHSIDHDPVVHGLEVDDPERHTSFAVACPVPAGGCSMHTAYTLQYAAATTSTRPRRAYILVGRAKAAPRAIPVDNYWMRDKHAARMQRAETAG